MDDLVPYEQRDSAPIGAWIKLPYPDLNGTPIAQVRLLNIENLYLPELDEAGLLHPEKRPYLDRYMTMLSNGSKPPLITVIEMEDGRLRVVDGHRRVVAAKQLGMAEIMGYVSPLILLEDGKKHPLTAEILREISNNAHYGFNGECYSLSLK